MTATAMCNSEEYSADPATLASQVRWLYYGDSSGAGAETLAACSRVAEDEVSHIPDST